MCEQSFGPPAILNVKDMILPQHQESEAAGLHVFGWAVVFEKLL
jgi:hypothetical protein